MKKKLSKRQLKKIKEKKDNFKQLENSNQKINTTIREKTSKNIEKELKQTQKVKEINEDDVVFDKDIELLTHLEFSPGKYLILYPELKDTIKKLAPYGGGYAHYLSNSKSWNQQEKFKKRAPMEGLVSIIVPCYNSEKYLRYTLESILNQTYKLWECILVDDGSIDNTQEIMKEFRRMDSRFRITIHRANGGLSSARNTGIRLAKGEFMCFLDSDDLFMSKSIQNRVEHLLYFKDKYPDLKGTFSGYVYINDSIQKPTEQKEFNSKIRKIDIFNIDVNPFNVHQPLLFSKIVYSTLGFDESFLTGVEDWDFWIKILRMNCLLIPTNWIDMTYRQHADSMIKNSSLQHLAVANKLFNSLYEEDKDQILHKPLVEYQKQKVLCHRTLKYIGINIGININKKTDPDIKNLAKIFMKAIPDYFIVIYRHIDFFKVVSNGILRVISEKNNINNDHNQKLEEYIKQFLEYARKIHEDKKKYSKSNAIKKTLSSK